MIERVTGHVLAIVFGRRTDEVGMQLAALLLAEMIDISFTDDWGAYRRVAFAPIHVVGMGYTWRIVRKNLDLLTGTKK